MTNCACRRFVGKDLVHHLFVFFAGMFATAADDAVSLTETEIESLLADVDTSRLQAFTARFCSF